MLMRHEEQESHVEIARVTSKEHSLDEPPSAKYGHYYWKVIVIRETEDGTVQVSEPSEERDFWWLWSKETPAPEEPTPPPTKEPPPTEKPPPPSP